jgi:hypothetical protein
MIEVAELSLNTFGLSGQVQPSEQLITLTYGQLQDLIESAVNEATEPLWRMYESMEYERSLLARRVKELETRGQSPCNGDKERSIEIKKLIDERKSVSFAELRGKFNIGKTLLWTAIQVLLEDYPGEYAVKKSSSDKRSRFLIKLPVIK